MATFSEREGGSGQEDKQVDEPEDEVYDGEDGEEVERDIPEDEEAYPEDEEAYPGILACQGRGGGLYPGVGGATLPCHITTHAQPP